MTKEQEQLYQEPDELRRLLEKVLTGQKFALVAGTTSPAGPISAMTSPFATVSISPSRVASADTNWLTESTIDEDYRKAIGEKLYLNEYNHLSNRQEGRLLGLLRAFERLFYRRGVK